MEPNVDAAVAMERTLAAAIAAAQWDEALELRAALLHEAARRLEPFADTLARIRAHDLAIDAARAPTLAPRRDRVAEDGGLFARQGREGALVVDDRAPVAVAAGVASHASGREVDARAALALADLRFAMDAREWSLVLRVWRDSDLSTLARSRGDVEREITELARRFDEARAAAAAAVEPSCARALASLDGSRQGAGAADSIRAFLEESGALLAPTSRQNLEHLRGWILAGARAPGAVPHLAAAVARGDGEEARRDDVALLSRAPSSVPDLVASIQRARRAMRDGAWSSTTAVEPELAALAGELSPADPVRSDLVEFLSQRARVRAGGRSIGARLIAHGERAIAAGIARPLPAAIAGWLERASFFLQPGEVEALRTLHARACEMRDAGVELTTLVAALSESARARPDSELRTRLEALAQTAGVSAAMVRYQSCRAEMASPGGGRTRDANQFPGSLSATSAS